MRIGIYKHEIRINFCNDMRSFKIHFRIVLRSINAPKNLRMNEVWNKNKNLKWMKISAWFRAKHLKSTSPYLCAKHLKQSLLNRQKKTLFPPSNFIFPRKKNHKANYGQAFMFSWYEKWFFFHSKGWMMCGSTLTIRLFFFFFATLNCRISCIL